MIIFDKAKFVDDIITDGIGATDKDARYKISLLFDYFLSETEYRKSVIVSKVKEIASDYFDGLPDDIVEKELSLFYSAAKEKKDKGIVTKEESKTITLYHSEMQTIKALEDDKLMRLAFAALIMHKFCGQYVLNGEPNYYTNVKACTADIYRIAGLSSLSAQKKLNLWQDLAKRGLIRFGISTNHAWRFNPDWITIKVYTCLFNADLKDNSDKNSVYMRISNYDNLLLILDYYLGRKSENEYGEVQEIILCSECGIPIIKTTGNKCYCSRCAVIKKKDSDNHRYQKKAQMQKSEN